MASGFQRACVRKVKGQSRCILACLAKPSGPEYQKCGISVRSWLWTKPPALVLVKVVSKCHNMLQTHPHQWYVISQLRKQVRQIAASSFKTIIIIHSLCPRLEKQAQLICHPNKRQFRPLALALEPRDLWNDASKHLPCYAGEVRRTTGICRSDAAQALALSVLHGAIS